MDITYDLQSFMRDLTNIQEQTFKESSFASILGINMDWLSFMGRAGCQVALIGANLPLFLLYLLYNIPLAL
jgi:uncharacterized membrane protein